MARSAPADWLTLRQASAATGIPVSTLRNWARKGKVASSLEETPAGARRMVSLKGVEDRARQLGQNVDAVVETMGTEIPPTSVRQDQVSQPPGTVLVPIDAWDKMLLQLGNLHQAGQQLAEARERAARAETEADFLRERLAELRSSKPGSDPVHPTVEAPPPIEEEPEPAKPTRMPSFTAYLWRLAVSDRRRK